MLINFFRNKNIFKHSMINNISNKIIFKFIIGCNELMDDLMYVLFYLTKSGFWSSLSVNWRWLSMIWNSSWGCGILPVSSFDQIGTSFKEISKAPDEISCKLNIKKIRKAYEYYFIFSLPELLTCYPKRISSYMHTIYSPYTNSTSLVIFGPGIQRHRTMRLKQWSTPILWLE